MTNLIIKNKRGSSILNQFDIHPEDKIEKIIFETENILPDVFLLKRQLSTYSKDRRIDLVGLDNENNILIIEIKAEMVTEKIISQVMEYALWVETHPDAIKSIWLEQEDKPEEFTFDWDKEINIRIMIIGPSFKPSVQKLVNKINYEVDLIEIKFFIDGDTYYIYENKIEAIEEKPSKPVSTIRKYDLDFYKKNYNTKSGEEFWKLAEKIENYIKEKEWNLDRSNNKHFISFKYGFPQVFGITFIGSKSFCLFFKIPKDLAEKIKIEDNEMLRYEDQWKQALYKVDDSNIDLEKFEPLFKESYEYITRK